jgi:hypothetical protein
MLAQAKIELLALLGRDNGLELLLTEGMAQDSSDSDQQIQEQERVRDDQDEARYDHSFPQSTLGTVPTCV